MSNDPTTTPTPPESPLPNRARIVVGVVTDQPAEVLTTAVTYATRFDAQLICAYVDDSRYTVEVRPEGSILSMPIDPDTTAEASAEFDPELLTRIGSSLDGSGVEWSTRAGIRGSLHEFFNGSVAIQLAHHQHRPLVVVPSAAAPEPEVGK